VNAQKPIVAIVGRPNVGKSTLFNRLVGRRLAIVHDQPGVTRDRHYADAHVAGREITLVDTGGLDPTTEDPMGRGIERQAEVAIEEADVVLCLLDASGAPTEPDAEAVSLLRRGNKPVLFVANKVDNPERELAAAELYALGIAELVHVSALHGRGVADLESALKDALPARVEPPAEPDAEEASRVALLGRPNAGKSSLFNRLAGSERSLVDERPGTTRDPVDSLVTWQGRPYLLVDTAGIRRRPRVERGVEAVSVMRALRAIDRAEVIVLLCDAAEGIAEQDARLLGLCIERRRAVIVGLNKIDLLREKKARQAAVERARDRLRFARWAPIVELSARTGLGVAELMNTVAVASEDFRRRVPTAELNRFFEKVLATHPPPTHAGRAPRIYYVTQAESAPPLFVAVSNAPQAIKEGSRRYVANQIRDAFGFGAVPVHVEYRKKADRLR
jgi:GTP-binding protein